MCDRGYSHEHTIHGIDARGKEEGYKASGIDPFRDLSSRKMPCMHNGAYKLNMEGIFSL